MAARLRVGTASWTDPTLIRCGRFYPKGANSAEARLRYYASRFDLVEVDSSYYALPSATNATLWAERTPEGFVFNVKAFRLFTGHRTPVAALPAGVRTALGAGLGERDAVYYKDLPDELRDALWEYFTAGIAPLARAGKLGLVLFQFAPWVVRSPRALEHIDDCRARLAHCTLAIEFRHRSWFAAEATRSTLDFERERGLVNVVVDEPQGAANTVPAIWEATDPEHALVRLHGRNAQTWNSSETRSASDRFNYDYSDAELADIAVRVKALARDVTNVHVIFNNNYEDQGQRNATTLRALLGQGAAASA